jgi:hypothetical protein
MKNLKVKNRVLPVLLVPMARIERATSPLPRECSTTELHRRIPLNWYSLFLSFSSTAMRPAQPTDFVLPPWRLERVKGIEPSS